MFIEPVFGKKFFGREEVLATLHKRVAAIRGGYRQNLALAGPMLSGKSSILRHFLKNIKEMDVIPLYVEMASEDFATFCTRFMGTLLYHYQRFEGGKAEGDFDILKTACSLKLPRTINCMEEISSLLNKKKEDDAYEKMLDLTSIFRSESGKNCVVILDEFHNLANFNLKKPFQTFGRFIMVQKNTMYIVSSSQKTLLKDILSKKLSLLFGNFEVIEVNGFDNQTARAFIADKIGVGPIEVEIVDYLVQLTQGNPFYLETIIKRLSQIMNASVNKSDIKECLLCALSELLYESEGILNQYFTNNVNFFLETKSRKGFLPVILSLAKGNCKVKAIKNDLNKSESEIIDKLHKLEFMDLVYRSGVFYKIEDKLFEFWLKSVYAPKMESVVDELDIKYLEFKNTVEADFKEHRIFSAKDISGVVSCLLSAFRSEKIRINMNERIMPCFGAVETVHINPGMDRIVAYLGDNVWIADIKKTDLADDQDVFSLSSLKTFGDKYKVSRKILIPVNGMEHNAFLLAKEQGVWIWDIKQLNDILRLYGKYELAL
ncbi:MAG TPA: ATP-binding protein [Candidatus Omnitrophota bacterium]|nr:ATP-binding protein [Candidatus Omnitrophota bacterium]HPS20849.1 ATP-binding protein [Candidatus Omnitrophota bacterium]